MTTNDSRALAAKSLAVVTEGAAIIVVVLLVALVSGCRDRGGEAVSTVLSALISGNETSAIGALRAINAAQAAFSSNCAGGGYAIRLEDLAAAPPGNNTAFISPDLNANGVIKSGYIITLAKDGAPGVSDVGSTTACNGTISQPASSYYASAEPVTPGGTGTRAFATDARGLVFYAAGGTAPANPIPSTAVLVQ